MSRESGRAAADAGYVAAFDRLFLRGREAVLAGTHYRDTRPVDGGRWGMSVALLPDAVATSTLARLTAEAMAVAGPWHWPTGAPESVHFTVRAMEAYRSDIPTGDPLAGRCMAALTRAAARCRPVRFRLGGLTLTPSGVMAGAYPVDDAADEFADRLGEALGPDGWFEADFHRDIWYATLVHFTGEIRDPSGLVEWVDRRRDLDLGEATIDGAELLRFRYDGRQPVRVRLGSAALTGQRTADSIPDPR